MNLIALPEWHRQDLNYVLLMRRGWVTQERLRSPRSIYSGQELQWECTETTASEVFPTRMPILEERPLGHGSTEPYPIATLLNSEAKDGVQHRLPCSVPYATSRHYDS
jgi:hypothetical protein